MITSGTSRAAELFIARDDLRADTLGVRIVSRDQWSQYETRKAQIQQTSESAAEYERRLHELVEELGV